MVAWWTRLTKKSPATSKALSNKVDVWEQEGGYVVSLAKSRNLHTPENQMKPSKFPGYSVSLILLYLCLCLCLSVSLSLSLSLSLEAWRGERAIRELNTSGAGPS